MCVVIGALSAVVGIGGAIVLKLGDFKRSFSTQLFYAFAIVYSLESMRIYATSSENTVYSSIDGLSYSSSC